SVVVTLATDIPVTLGPIALVVKAGETHLQLIKDQGVSGDLGGTVKVPQNGSVAEGHFALHLQRGHNTGSADLNIKEIGPFAAIPNLHAEYNQGRGFTVTETDIHLQD